jgi:hypothetical protein
MKSSGKPSRRKKGVGSIIGAVFLVLIILSGFTFYQLYLNIADHYNGTLQSIGESDWSRNREKIVIKNVEITGSGNLSVTVENEGTLQSHLIWFGIFNLSALPETQAYYPLDISVDPAETRSVVSVFTVAQGKKYAVQLVTELGNTIGFKFYPASEVRCALSLTVASVTTYDGNNVTVMLTVTHNDTEVDAIQSLTASINVAPEGTLVQLVDNSPLTVTGLARGESAFFWWVYNMNHTGTVTFNATYGSAPAGIYALAKVDILASPGLGGGGSVSISGVNGTAEYNPSQWNPLGSTQNVNGSISDLANDDVNYAFFRSCQTASSDQPLYAHSETTIINGSQYYLQKLTSADGTPTSLSASMNTVGRQLFGKFVYPLTGVSLIPASTWTTYYRSWKDADPSPIVYVRGTGGKGTVSTSSGASTTINSGDFVFIHISIAGITRTVNSFTLGTGNNALLLGGPVDKTTVRSYLYYYMASSNLGSITPTLTLSGSGRHAWTMAVYTGVNPSSPYSGYNSNSGSAASPTAGTVVENSAGNMVVSGSAFGENIVGAYTITIAPSGSPAETERQEQDQAGATGTGNYGVSSQTEEYATTSAPRTNGANGTDSTRALNWVMQVVTLNIIPTPAGHCDIDILIRKSDGTVRSTIATNVTTSGAITISASTLSGTYAWALYNVADQTDYLEIDYYVDVTTAAAGTNAYLRIDDTTLALSDQTRITNIMLPSEYTAEVEFTGSSNLLTWTQLVWQVDSSWGIGSVNVTIQLYDYTLGPLGGYPLSGDGYLSYVSNSTSNTDELKNEQITSGSTRFRNSTSPYYWKVKIKGAKPTSTPFLMKIDWIDLQTTYSTTNGIILYNAWQLYSIKATTTSGGPIPYAYVSIYANGTLVYFRNVTDKVDIGNPAWVRLDAGGQLMLEVKSASGSGETFVLYAVVGSIVGQKTVTQEAP